MVVYDIVCVYNISELKHLPLFEAFLIELLTLFHFSKLLSKETLLKTKELPQLTDLTSSFHLAETECVSGNLDSYVNLILPFPPAPPALVVAVVARAPEPPPPGAPPALPFDVIVGPLPPAPPSNGASPPFSVDALFPLESEPAEDPPPPP